MNDKEKRISAALMRRMLRELADPAIAEHSQRFFKTGKGEYGEGDLFLGIRVPVIRKEVKKCQGAALLEVDKLLKSKFHEERLMALLLLVQKFARGNEGEKKAIYQLYLDRTKYINNWDLVDCSAPNIVGGYLENRNRRILRKLARSSSLWERRIAIMATFQFIRSNDYDDALSISTMLLSDEEDLIHKAVGWMLREVGNRDRKAEVVFLKAHYKNMPRTMLRYAIEKFPQATRKRYLEGKI